jgi:hypothetical protein
MAIVTAVLDVTKGVWPINAGSQIFWWPGGISPKEPEENIGFRKMKG